MLVSTISPQRRWHTLAPPQVQQQENVTRPIKLCEVVDKNSQNPYYQQLISLNGQQNPPQLQDAIRQGLGNMERLAQVMRQVRYPLSRDYEYEINALYTQRYPRQDAQSIDVWTKDARLMTFREVVDVINDLVSFYNQKQEVFKTTCQLMTQVLKEKDPGPDCFGNTGWYQQVSKRFGLHSERDNFGGAISFYDEGAIRSLQNGAKSPNPALGSGRDPIHAYGVVEQYDNYGRFVKAVHSCCGQSFGAAGCWIPLDENAEYGEPIPYQLIDVNFDFWPVIAQGATNQQALQQTLLDNRIRGTAFLDQVYYNELDIRITQLWAALVPVISNVIFQYAADLDQAIQVDGPRPDDLETRFSNVQKQQIKALANAVDAYNKIHCADLFDVHGPFGLKRFIDNVLIQKQRAFAVYTEDRRRFVIVPGFQGGQDPNQAEQIQLLPINANRQNVQDLVDALVRYVAFAQLPDTTDVNVVNAFLDTDLSNLLLRLENDRDITELSMEVIQRTRTIKPALLGQEQFQQLVEPVPGAQPTWAEISNAARNANATRAQVIQRANQAVRGVVMDIDNVYNAAITPFAESLDDFEQSVQAMEDTLPQQVLNVDEDDIRDLLTVANAITLVRRPDVQLENAYPLDPADALDQLLLDIDAVADQQQQLQRANNLIPEIEQVQMLVQGDANAQQQLNDLLQQAQQLVTDGIFDQNLLDRRRQLTQELQRLQIARNSLTTDAERVQLLLYVNRNIQQPVRQLEVRMLVPVNDFEQFLVQANTQLDEVIQGATDAFGQRLQDIRTGLLNVQQSIALVPIVRQMNALRGIPFPRMFENRISSTDYEDILDQLETDDLKLFFVPRVSGQPFAAYENYLIGTWLGFAIRLFDALLADGQELANSIYNDAGEVDANLNQLIQDARDAQGEADRQDALATIDQNRFQQIVGGAIYTLDVAERTQALDNNPQIAVPAANQPIITTNSPRFTDLRFGGSCAFDTFMVMFFSVPRTVLENRIRESQNVFVVQQSTNDFERGTAYGGARGSVNGLAVADRLNTALLTDIHHIQSGQAGQGDRICMQSPQFYLDMTNVFNEQETTDPLAVFNALWEIYRIDNNLRIPILNFNVQQTINNAAAAGQQMIIVFDNSTFAQRQVGRDMIVPFMYDNDRYILAAVAVNMGGGHWRSFVNDPHTLQWWIFDQTTGDDIRRPVQNDDELNQTRLQLQNSMPAMWVYQRVDGYGSGQLGRAATSATPATPDSTGPQNNNNVPPPSPGMSPIVPDDDSGLDSPTSSLPRREPDPNVFPLTNPSILSAYRNRLDRIDPEYVLDLWNVTNGVNLSPDALDYADLVHFPEQTGDDWFIPTDVMDNDLRTQALLFAYENFVQLIIPMEGTNIPYEPQLYQDHIRMGLATARPDWSTIPEEDEEDDDDDIPPFESLSVSDEEEESNDDDDDDALPPLPPQQNTLTQQQQLQQQLEILRNAFRDGRPTVPQNSYFLMRVMFPHISRRTLVIFLNEENVITDEEAAGLLQRYNREEIFERFQEYYNERANATQPGPPQPNLPAIPVDQLQGPFELDEISRQGLAQNPLVNLRSNLIENLWRQLSGNVSQYINDAARMFGYDGGPWVMPFNIQNVSQIRQEAYLYAVQVFSRLLNDEEARNEITNEEIEDALNDIRNALAMARLPRGGGGVTSVDDDDDDILPMPELSLGNPSLEFEPNANDTIEKFSYQPNENNLIRASPPQPIVYNLNVPGDIMVYAIGFGFETEYEDEAAQYGRTPDTNIPSRDYLNFPFEPNDRLVFSYTTRGERAFQTPASALSERQLSDVSMVYVRGEYIRPVRYYPCRPDGSHDTTIPVTKINLAGIETLLLLESVRKIRENPNLTTWMLLEYVPEFGRATEFSYYTGSYYTPCENLPQGQRIILRAVPINPTFVASLEP